MKQANPFEHLLSTNPGVDAKLVAEAENKLEALRQAGVDYDSEYGLEPALGTAVSTNQGRVASSNQSDNQSEPAEKPDR